MPSRRLPQESERAWAALVERAARVSRTAFPHLDGAAHGHSSLGGNLGEPETRRLAQAVLEVGELVERAEVEGPPLDVLRANRRRVRGRSFASQGSLDRALVAGTSLELAVRRLEVELADFRALDRRLARAAVSEAERAALLRAAHDLQAAHLDPRPADRGRLAAAAAAELESAAQLLPVRRQVRDPMLHVQSWWSGTTGPVLGALEIVTQNLNHPLEVGFRGAAYRYAARALQRYAGSTSGPEGLLLHPRADRDRLDRLPEVDSVAGLVRARAAAAGREALRRVASRTRD